MSNVNYEEFLTNSENSTSTEEISVGVKHKEGNYECVLLGVTKGESAKTKCDTISLKWGVIDDEFGGEFKGTEFKTSHNVTVGTSTNENMGQAIESAIKALILLGSWAGSRPDFAKLTSRPGKALLDLFDDIVSDLEDKDQRFACSIKHIKSEANAEGNRFWNNYYSKREESIVTLEK